MWVGLEANRLAMEFDATGVHDDLEVEDAYVGTDGIVIVSSRDPQLFSDPLVARHIACFLRCRPRPTASTRRQCLPGETRGCMAEGCSTGFPARSTSDYGLI